MNTETEAQTEEIETEDPKPGQEVAVRTEPKPPVEAGAGGFILPRNMDEAYRMAVGVVKGGLAPNSYNNDPSQIMLGIMAAMEAGLPPLYGLRQIAIIQGRPTIWGDAAMALVQKTGLLTDQKVIEIGSSFDPNASPAEWPDDFGIHVSLWRRGQDSPYVGEFTVADAKRAGLWMNTRKTPWIQHPKRMLTMRARAFPLRDGFADALAGLYIREEVEDYSVIDHRPATSTEHDDEPVTAEDAARDLTQEDEPADTGTTSELPLGTAPQDQGAETDPQQKEE